MSANEPVYVRLRYSSDQPLRFQARGYLSGAEETRSASFNPAPVYAAGTGEAIVWTAYFEAAAIDEIRITVTDAEWTPLDELSVPMRAAWNGMRSQAQRQRAEWVQTLSAQQQAMVAAGARAGGSDDGNEGLLWGWLLMLMGWSIPGYIALQFYTVKRYEGRWRTLALLPLWIMIPLVAYTLFALLAGSNLWPLMMLFLAPLALVYLLAVLSLRKVYGKALP